MIYSTARRVVDATILGGGRSPKINNGGKRDAEYTLEKTAHDSYGRGNSSVHGGNFIDRVRQRMMEEGMADERTIFIINHFTHNCAEGNGHAELAEAAGRLGMLAAYDGMEVFTPLCAK